MTDEFESELWREGAMGGGFGVEHSRMTISHLALERIERERPRGVNRCIAALLDAIAHLESRVLKLEDELSGRDGRHGST